MKKICVMNLSAPGLATAVAAAQAGFQVVGYDVDPLRVFAINNEEASVAYADDVVMFSMESLSAMLFAGKFRAQILMAPADCFIIYTPINFDAHGTADTTLLHQAVEAISDVIKKYNLVVIASIVPFGTIKQVAHMLQQKTGLVAGEDFYVAYCPEQAGTASYQEKFLVGGLNDVSARAAQHVYEKFIPAPVQLFSAEVVEMTVLAVQAAQLIDRAFTQELMLLAKATQINPYELITLVKEGYAPSMPPRCGVDDAQVFSECLSLLAKFPTQTQVVQAAAKRDKQQVKALVADIMATIKTLGVKRGKVLFLSPVPLESSGAESSGTESSGARRLSWSIIENCMKQRGIEVKICDPYVTDVPMISAMPRLIDLTQGLVWADLVVCLASNVLFRARAGEIAQHPQVIDACGLLYTNPYQESQFFAAEPIDAADLFEEMMHACVSDASDNNSHDIE